MLRATTSDELREAVRCRDAEAARCCGAELREAAGSEQVSVEPVRAAAGGRHRTLVTAARA